jgi:hypothetical protein
MTRSELYEYVVRHNNHAVYANYTTPLAELCLWLEERHGEVIPMDACNRVIRRFMPWAQ